MLVAAGYDHSDGPADVCSNQPFRTENLFVVSERRFIPVSVSQKCNGQGSRLASGCWIRATEGAAPDQLVQPLRTGIAAVLRAGCRLSDGRGVLEGGGVSGGRDGAIASLQSVGVGANRKLKTL